MRIRCTDSCRPGKSATPAVAWTVGSMTQHGLPAIVPNDSVEVSVYGGRFTNLGSYAKQIGSGLDASNKPGGRLDRRR